MFWYFFYLFKGGRGHELFKNLLNLLRGEGIGLISLFWKNNCWKMETKDGLGVSLFFKALIVDGGEEEKGVFYISSLFLFSCL
jgi:hypothetical protein